MPTPVTFSPPGTAYVPSAEDALRDGVLLMMKADNVTRAEMTFDGNEAKGVRIYAGPEAATHPDGHGGRKIVIPQLLVTSSFGSTRFAYETNKGGERQIAIVITLLEAINSSYLVMNVESFRITAESKMARVEQVLQLGTIMKADSVTNGGRVVDPYLSPLLPDGTYDPDGPPRYLNMKPPEIARQVSLVGEIAVAYSLIATYSVNVSNRESTTARGNQ